jgi:hypothetical protein
MTHRSFDFGGDETRGGIPPINLQGADTMELAARIADESAFHRTDAIFIDGRGVEGGVVDRCRQMALTVTDVQFGAKSDRVPIGEDRPIGSNKGAEMWGNLREWLRGGTIDNDPELIADLTGIEYGYVLRDGRDAIELERKEDMKRRGLATSDNWGSACSDLCVSGTGVLRRSLPPAKPVLPQRLQSLYPAAGRDNRGSWSFLGRPRLWRAVARTGAGAAFCRRL